MSNLHRRTFVSVAWEAYLAIAPGHLKMQRKLRSKLSRYFSRLSYTMLPKDNDVVVEESEATVNVTTSHSHDSPPAWSRQA